MHNESRIVKILLDTNFLLIPFQFRINIKSKFDELLDVRYELIILNSVYNELLKIVNNSKGKRKQEILAAIRYYESFPKQAILEKQKNESVDDLLLRIVCEKNFIIATNDKALKRRLNKNGKNFIYLRQKSHFKSKHPIG